MPGIREMACLFATRFDQVLLSTKDGVHWHFPQEELKRNRDGTPAERPVDAIRRIVDKIDGLEYDEVMPEGAKEYKSHKGDYVYYHIFITPSKLIDGELKSNGVKYEWTSNPHAKNLNECTRIKLMSYTFYPLT